MALSTPSSLQVHLPPQSKEAEMMVLGCMLTDINCLNSAVDLLVGADFYFIEHQLIFDVIKEAYCEDRPVDVHIAAERLKQKGLLAKAGGVSLLTTLAQYVGTSAYIEEYIRIVKDKSILRRMAITAKEIEKDALGDPPDVQVVLDGAQAKLFQISQAAGSSQGKLVADILSGVKAASSVPFLKELELRQERFKEHGPQLGVVTGIPTHFDKLDQLVNGLNRSNLMILAARPAMGKTAFALNIAANICFREKKPVGVFSLEMSAEQLVQRLVAMHAKVPSEKIKTGNLKGEEYQKIVMAVSEMQESVMLIDDQPGIKISDLRARARRMKEAHGIEFLVIDYLQLLSGSGSNRSQENRQVEISEISRMLKNLARELDIPVLCLAQLSRKVEERAGHRPQMSDLRESGSIEQDADEIIFLMRRDYYDPHDKPGTADLIVAKNRHGGIGDVRLAFNKEYGLFGNYSE